MKSVDIILKSGETPNGGYLELDEDCSDEVFARAVQALLNKHVPGGWIAIGDVVVHVQAIESIEPR